MRRDFSCKRVGARVMGSGREKCERDGTSETWQKKSSFSQTVRGPSGLRPASLPRDPSATEMPDEVKSPPGREEAGFFPKGAIFFFVLLLLFYAALWFLIYGIMIARS